MTSLMAELQSWKTALADSTADSLYNTYVHTVCHIVTSRLSFACMYIHYDNNTIFCSTSILDYIHIKFTHVHMETHIHTYIQHRHCHSFKSLQSYCYLLCGDGTSCPHKRKMVYLMRLTSLQYIHNTGIYSTAQIQLCTPCEQFSCTPKWFNYTQI